MGERAYSEAEKRYLEELQASLGSVESLGLPALLCLLAIARQEGLSVTDLAQQTATPQQSVSRYVALLLGRYQLEAAPQPTPPLIEQRINPDDPRRRALFMTEAGREVITKLLNVSTTFPGRDS